MKRRHSLLAVALLYPALVVGQAAPHKSEPTSSAPSTSGPYPVMSSAAKSRAKQIFEYFDNGQATQLYAAFSPDMKKKAPVSAVAKMSKDLATQLGHEDKLIGENFAPDLRARNTIYSRSAQFTKSKDPVFFLVAIDQQGQVVTMQFQPTPPPPGNRFSDYKVKTALKLPFDDEWFVYQGGSAAYENANAYRDAERYSTIFTVLKDGLPFSGDGSKNEQYYCYGKPVAAPADGAVVLISNSFADNVPGRSDQPLPVGNRVLISHGNGEYSLLMHLKQNSIKVKSGDKVKQGDIVAECGNSGNSPAPHLEYRLQNSKGVPYPYTLPAQFVDYYADGKEVASGRPVRGQFVHNGAQSAAAAPAPGKP